MKTVLAFVALGTTSLVAAACSGNDESSRETIWRLDRAATVAKAEPDARESVKKELQGVDVVLRLHGNRFDLGITGADRPEKSSGTFTSEADGKHLHRTTLNGARLPEGMDADLVARTDASHLYVFVGSLEVALSAK